MKKSQAWLPIVYALILTGGIIAGYKLRERMPYTQGFFDNRHASSVQEVMDLIRQNYVDPVAADSLSEDAINAILAHLDPHSIYIPAKYLQEVNEDLQGNFEGIGVEFQIISDTVHVVSVLKGGPSEKAGLQVGDRFIKVGDSVVSGNGITSDRIKRLLRGPGASTAKVVMLRDGAVREFVITRGTIPLYSVDASYMIDDTTGYVHLNKFSGTSYEECMQAFERLQEKGMRKLIFDLRDNGGGILGEAVDITDEFLDGEKLIVYTKGQKQPRTDYNCKRPGLFEKGKLVVLVDEGSASASEVIAGAVQDWDRGTVVGRRTFGKGLVQEQFNLPGGAALRLTVARYYTPAGRSIQKPYEKGRDAYNEEVLERFHNGEITADTARATQGTPYKTKGGRIVYGGGGITPDVIVPYDTAGFAADVSPLFSNQQFGKFIYLHFLTNQQYFRSFENPRDFGERFTPGDMTWSHLYRFISQNNINLPLLSVHDKQELNKRIKTWMARQIWGMPGFYEVNNTFDLTVAKAREIP